MSNPFVQRVANWLAQEVVVKGLSENKAFQRFALRTDHKLNELKKNVVEKVDVKEAAEKVSSASNFAKSIKDTIAREMTATPKPSDAPVFKSRQDILREAREAAAAAKK